MRQFLDYLHEFNYAAVALRLLLAMAAGGVIGYGRSVKRQSAGFRTYMLTSAGAALTMIISQYENQMLQTIWAAADGSAAKFDVSRIPAQVVSGIGFLAAGTIIAVAHQQISGLTTAIGLFASACMGIAAGAGFYECVIVAMVLIIITMEWLQPLEVSFKRKLRNITICVEFNELGDVNTVTETIESLGATIYDIDVERSQHEGELNPSMILSVKMSKGNASHSAMLSTIAELGCVYSVQELIS